MGAAGEIQSHVRGVVSRAWVREYRTEVVRCEKETAAAKIQARMRTRRSEMVRQRVVAHGADPAAQQVPHPLRVHVQLLCRSQKVVSGMSSREMFQVWLYRVCWRGKNV